MRPYLISLFKPPIFEDPERTRVARYLYYILLITVMGMIGFMVAPALFDYFDIWGVIICGSVIAISSTLLFFIRFGYVRLASIIFVGSTLSAISIGGFITTGIRTPGLIAVPLLLTICSLLLGSRATFITGVLCVLSISGLLFYGHPGHLIYHRVSWI